MSGTSFAFSTNPSFVGAISTITGATFKLNATIPPGKKLYLSFLLAKKENLAGNPPDNNFPTAITLGSFTIRGTYIFQDR
jgi:hypothetical protein